MSDTDDVPKNETYMTVKDSIEPSEIDLLKIEIEKLRQSQCGPTKAEIRQQKAIEKKAKELKSKQVESARVTNAKMKKIRENSEKYERLVRKELPIEEVEELGYTLLKGKEQQQQQRQPSLEELFRSL